MLTWMMRGERGQWEIWNKRLRDLGIYLLGLAGAANELFREAEPRWPALAFIATMLGLPIALRLDEAKKAAANGNIPPAPGG